MSKRQQILVELTQLLNDLEEFEDVALWDNLPSQYGQNAIYLKDTRASYEKKNNLYLATLRIEVLAIIIETSDKSAAELGNIALARLIGAVTQLSIKGVIVNLADSFKYIDTKGKTACQVELNIDVKYQFNY